MAASSEPIVIKKYANRRLYNTGSSTYVTLEDLATMVKEGTNFVVQDAKTGEDITRPVLAQIIFEQEGKEGQNLLPVNFLRQLISFYGDSMQAMVPSYLEHAMTSFSRNQDEFREQMEQMFGKQSVQGLDQMEAIARQNMEMFQKTMSMFMPFANSQTEQRASAQAEAGKASSGDDLQDLKAQLSALQRKLDTMG
ncbi:MAG: polyhydroxyalkanoate synthesis repressor PhaR [Nitratireductor sp.]|nr:polyhydroxyalkanoate synthesis repressor PhaR [Nitratireductor sp.]MCC0021839.1 polyhydroxyalkanoate synthesis repressor PhaR [Nitratireductor sp.]